MSLHLPAGKYYIGDPCYVFGNTWDRLLNEVNFNGDLHEFNGFKIWGHYTSIGDGTYFDQNGVEYPVDSGILAAIPIELVEDPAGEENGTIVVVNELTVEHENGVFWFGNICIDTADVNDNGLADPWSDYPDSKFNWDV